MMNGERYKIKVALSTFFYRMLALIKKQGIPTAIIPLNSSRGSNALPHPMPLTPSSASVAKKPVRNNALPILVAFRSSSHFSSKNKAIKKQVMTPNRQRCR